LSLQPTTSSTFLTSSSCTTGAAQPCSTRVAGAALQPTPPAAYLQPQSSHPLASTYGSAGVFNFPLRRGHSDAGPEVLPRPPVGWPTQSSHCAQGHFASGARTLMCSNLLQAPTMQAQSHVNVTGLCDSQHDPRLCGRVNFSSSTFSVGRESGSRTPSQPFVAPVAVHAPPLSWRPHSVSAPAVLQTEPAYQQQYCALSSGHQMYFPGQIQTSTPAGPCDVMTTCPYTSCPGIFVHCGGELVRRMNEERLEVWECRECDFAAYGEQQQSQPLLAMEVLPCEANASSTHELCDRDQRGLKCEGESSGVPAARGVSPKLVVKPLAKARVAVARVGGVLAMLAKSGVDFSLVEDSSQHHATFPLSELEDIREKLRAHKLLDALQSDVPEWVMDSFRGKVPVMADGDVEEEMSHMPFALRKSLLPFQEEGVRFGLRHFCRCLIGDEMGVPSATKPYRAGRRGTLHFTPFATSAALRV
jgi:hypothetical protein